jgi:putative transposase
MNIVSRRPKLRLRDKAAYSDVSAICSVTITVADRARIFADARVAERAVVVLKERAQSSGVVIYAFCVMPDHVHIVLRPSPSCDVITFVGQFKNLSQREAWALGVRGAFWQQSFWDEFVREGLEHVVRYVIENPVRAGLVADPLAYPFSGAFFHDGLAHKCGGQAPAPHPAGDCPSAPATFSEGEGTSGGRAGDPA